MFTLPHASLFATFFSPECDNYFKKSLFLVGEIGGNDYNYAYFAGGSIKQLRASVPLVVEAIAKATSFFDRRRRCGIVGAGEFADWMLGSVSDLVRKS